MKGKINILGVPFDEVNMKQATERVIDFIKSGDFKMICTPNPEIVMSAAENPEFMAVIKRADMVVADGVGVVWAAKYLGRPLEERVSGFDLAQSVFSAIKDSGYTVYFFGGAPGVAEKAKEETEKKFPGLKITGVHNGYFDSEEENNILKDIKDKAPNVLLVGLGSPKQEKWIDSHREELGAAVCIGVGGSFDVMAGEVKRAPLFFQKLGLEWLYRLIKQPSRFKRMLKLPQFVLCVIKNGKGGV